MALPALTVSSRLTICSDFSHAWFAPSLCRQGVLMFSGRKFSKRAIALLIVCLVVTPDLSHAAPAGIVVASSGGKDTAQFQQWQEFRRHIDEDNTGGLLLDYLIFGELGTPQSMLQAVISGRASIGAFGCAGITQTIPEFAVPQMPFLFGSSDEADYVFERYLTSIYSDILDKHGLVLLQWVDYGFMNLYSKEPVEFPTQLIGKQMRTAGNIVGSILLQAIKAVPTEIGISEIALSVQTDKLFGGLGMLQSYGRLQQSFHYFTNTHHAYDCGMVVANKTWFESATPREQEILRNAYPKMRDTRGSARAQEKSLTDKYNALGTVFLTLTPEQHNAWAAAGLPLYPSILQKAGGRSIEIYDLIRAGKQAYLRDPASGEHH